MLLLTRKVGDGVIINDDIKLQIISVSGKTVRIGFEYPSGVKILRKEIYERILQENLKASEQSQEVSDAIRELEPKKKAS